MQRKPIEKAIKQIYDLVVYIGRFKPPHRAHIQLMEMALEQGKELLVLAGSAYRPRDTRNPWTWQESADMITRSLPSDARVRILPLPDYMYNDQKWIQTVQSTVNEVAELIGADPGKIAIIGHSKDDSSYYLKLFPQFKTIEAPMIEDIHAKDIRAAYWMMNPDDFDDKVGKLLPPAIHNYLKAFALRPEYEQLVREYKFLLDYWSYWEGLKHPVQFLTGDAVVIQSGHILLVRRRAEPGRGLWAFPGGFINTDERIVDGVFRELKEETRIDCAPAVLRGSIVTHQIYDHPGRSLRGRTVTEAYLIFLRQTGLHDVRAGSDAGDCRWVQFGVFEGMSDQMFEDHWHIGMDMLGRLKHY